MSHICFQRCVPLGSMDSSRRRPCVDCRGLLQSLAYLYSPSPHQRITVNPIFVIFTLALNFVAFSSSSTDTMFSSTKYLVTYVRSSSERFDWERLSTDFSYLRCFGTTVVLTNITKVEDIKVQSPIALGSSSPSRTIISTRKRPIERQVTRVPRKIVRGEAGPTNLDPRLMSQGDILHDHQKV